MKAKIDNKILKVRIINNNYNDHAKEVEILEGTFMGVYTIVKNKDFIEDKKEYRYYLQRTETEYTKCKTITLKKFETLEDAQKMKKKCDHSNHSNIYSYRILDRKDRVYY
jgi:hypothetical protein